MVYRVVHCGTGMIGRAGLDDILNHPERAGETIVGTTRAFGAADLV